MTTKRLTAAAVVLLARQAHANACAQDVEDEGELAELVGFEFQQLLLQAVGATVGASTETGYYLLPQVPLSEVAA